MTTIHARESLDLEPSSSKKWAPPGEWERYRPLIKRLYIIEDKTLREVMRVMSSEHGLYGTPRMFKSRIKKWQLEKYHREKDMEFVLQKTAERHIEGKETSFLVRGKKVTQDETIRYFRRRKKNLDALRQVPRQTSKTPPHISYRTPSPDSITSRSPSSCKDATLTFGSPNPTASINSASPIDRLHRKPNKTPPPSLILAPASLRIPETLFRSISNYFDRCIHLKIWQPQPGNQYGSCKPGGFTIAILNCFAAYCQCAINFLENDAIREARQILSKACDLIPDILRSEHPRNLDFLLDCFLDLIRHGHEQIAQLLIHHIADMASEILPAGNMGAQSFRFLATVEQSQLVVVTLKSLECVAAKFHERLGSSHRSATGSYIRFLRQSYYNDDPLQAEFRIREHLSMSETLYGRESYAVIRILHGLIELVFAQRRYEEVEILGMNAAERASVLGLFVIWRNCMYRVACSQRELGKLPQAEATMRYIIRRSLEETGSTAYVEVIVVIQELENWLRKWGRSEEADRLKENFTILTRLDDVDDVS